MLVIAGYGYGTTHIGRGGSPAGPPRRRARGRELHDRRRARARRLVRPVAQRRGRDLVPGPQRVRRSRRGCSRATATACCCSTAAARVTSEGEPNAWGWGGDARRQGRDRLPAAPARRRPRPHRRDRALGRRRDADRDGRARTTTLAAVVSEGAGARSLARGDGHDAAARARMLGTRSPRARPPRWPCSPNEPPPANLKDLAAKMRRAAAPDRRTGKSDHGEELNRGYARAAGDSALALGDPRGRPRRRPQGTAAGIRAARDRLLRPDAGAMSGSV